MLFEIDAAGRISVRWTLPNGAYHRTMFEPGGAVEAQIDAIDQHLARMGFAPISGGDRAILNATIAAYWTKDVLAAAAARREAAAAEVVS